MGGHSPPRVVRGRKLIVLYFAPLADLQTQLQISNVILQLVLIFYCMYHQVLHLLSHMAVFLLTARIFVKVKEIQRRIWQL